MTEFDRSDEKMRDLGLQSQCGELMLSCACVCIQAPARHGLYTNMKVTLAHVFSFSTTSDY